MINLNFVPQITKLGGGVTGTNQNGTPIIGTPTEGTFPHLIDIPVSKLLSEKIMMEKPELFQVGYDLFSTGEFEATEEEINQVKQLVYSTNEYNGVQVDGLYKSQIIAMFI